MSRWEIRRCSRSRQGVNGAPVALTPRSADGRPSMVSSKPMCAPPPPKRYRRCSRRDFSLSGPDFPDPADRLFVFARLPALTLLRLLDFFAITSPPPLSFRRRIFPHLLGEPKLRSLDTTGPVEQTWRRRHCPPASRRRPTPGVRLS